jgi:gliding motility-associated-like protein
LAVLPTEGCEQLPVIFRLQTSYKAQYTWDLDFKNGKTLNKLTPKDSIQGHSYTNGSYSAEAKLTTSMGCTGIFSSPVVIIHPKPKSFFTWKPEIPTLDQPETLFENKSTGSNSWNWDFNSLGNSTDFSPTFTFKDTGHYPITLVASSDKDCKDTFVGIVEVGANYKLFIPTSFTPNGDGNNETWMPFTSGIIYMKFKLINRWGEIIFLGNQTTPWNGTYLGKPVPEGVYAYQVEVKNKFGFVEYHHGAVTILR